MSETDVDDEDSSRVLEGVVRRIGVAQNYHGLMTFVLLQGGGEVIDLPNPDIQSSAMKLDIIRQLALTAPGDQVRISCKRSWALIGKGEWMFSGYENLSLDI